MFEIKRIVTGNRWVLALLVVASVMAVAVRGVGADDNFTVFEDVRPDYVWEITLQIDDGTDYFQYVHLGEDLNGCDMSRPAAVRTCEINVAALTRQFREVRFVDHVSEVPASVNWQAWDWDRMTLDAGGYTPVFLSATMKEWNPETEQTTEWWVACSIVPDQPKNAICREARMVYDPTTVTQTVQVGADRDVYYTVVRAKQLLYIHDRLAADDVHRLAENTTMTFGEVVGGIYE